MMNLLKCVFSLSIFFSLVGYAQTYEIVKVEIECEAQELSGELNSESNDFSPYVFDNTIYFSSDRNPDVLIEGQNNWKKTKVVNLFQADLKGEFGAAAKMKNPRLVSERFEMGSHSGPGSFSVTGDTLFLTQVRIDKKLGDYYPQLYYTVRMNNRFTNLTPLPFNDPNYSFGHPFYSSKEQRLYFSSNKPGGKGGKDLYFSDLTDTGWTAPEGINNVNTEEDELFPFVADDILFYATNVNGRNGGLDIYWNMLSYQDSESKLLKGLNSESDDFGIYIFPGMTKGLFSSNRGGNDDVMYFDMQRVVTIRNEMAGEFKFKTLSGVASGITVQIVDDNDFVLYETKTDENGNFVFKSIETDQSYAIRAISEEDLDLTLMNEKGNNAADLLGDEDNVFSYRKIGLENTGTLALIPDDMIDFDLSQGHLSGQFLFENKPNEFPKDLKVSLIDENGNESFSTLTDKNGNFDFKKLSMNENYILKVPSSNNDLVLLIYDLKGNVVAQLKTNENGEFTFRKLAADYSNRLDLEDEGDDIFELESQTIWGYFEYENNKKLNRSNLIVQAFNEDGSLVEQELTDKDGVFRFKNLPSEKSLLFKVEENGENFILDDFTLYIFDRNGQKIAGLKRGQDGFFTYRPLGYDLDNSLSLMEEEHLEFILGPQGNSKRITVYFDSNQSQVKSNDIKVLNNLAKVMIDNPKARFEINAYADAKSSDEYNLILSQKRGDWIVDYVTKKGVDKSRIIVNAYGESRLIDQQNDALNRRAEIHLY